MFLLIVDNPQSHIPNRNGLIEKSFKDYFAYMLFHSNTSAIFLCPEENKQFIY